MWPGKVENGVLTTNREVTIVFQFPFIINVLLSVRNEQFSHNTITELADVFYWYITETDLAFS